MRSATLLCFFAAALLAACGDDSSSPHAEDANDRDPRGDETMQLTPKPHPGGSTRDFGGACAACAEKDRERIELAWDDDSVIGRAPSQIIARVEGAYAASAVWRDSCGEGACGFDADCPRAAPSFAETSTELRLEIARMGSHAEIQRCHDGRGVVAPDASALERAAYEECPNDYVHLPVRVVLRSDDGLLDEAIETAIVVGDPDGALSVGGDHQRAHVAGSIAQALPELDYIEWNAWFDTGRGISLYANSGSAPDDSRHPQTLAHLAAASSDPCEEPALQPVD